MPQIVDLVETDVIRIEEVAEFLLECTRKYAPDWLLDLDACREEIHDSFDANRRSRVLLDDAGHAIGWIGAITDDHVWEIHPIVIAPNHQRRGYGRMLVEDISELARASGAVSVWAGTSDETGSTSFSSAALYQSPTAAMVDFDVPKDHPVNFWLALGFSLVGVMPDEEGLSKPGIHFARRIAGDTA